MQFWPPDDEHMCSKHVEAWNKTYCETHETATYRCDDTRGCVMQFWPPDDEHMCSKHVEAWNKTYCETNFVHKLVKYRDKYTEMHGQQNVNTQSN